jgi:exonuclease III
MKLLAWNCRGLGNPRAVRGLLRCQKSEEADILFLSETKLDRKGMEKIQMKLGMGNMVEVAAVGRGGGNCCVMAEGDSCGFAKLLTKPHKCSCSRG